MNLTIDHELVWNGPQFAGDMYDELVEGFYKAAVRIRDTARSLVPVKTGKLRDSIRARKSRKRGAIGKLIQFLTAGGSYYKDDPAAFVFAGNRREGVYWHYFVEYGTYNKPAHPFMRPAMDASFNAVLAEAERAGKRAINKRRRERRKI